MKFKVSRKKEESTSRLYILEIIVDGHTVYKIGKASGANCKQRMLQIVGSYFDVYRVTPVIKVVRDRPCDDVFTKETKCHNELALFRYISEEIFSGHTELFKTDKEKVIEVYERILGCE